MATVGLSEGMRSLPEDFWDDDSPIFIDDSPPPKKAEMTRIVVETPVEEDWPTEVLSDDDLLDRAKIVVAASLEGCKVSTGQLRAALAVINNAARQRGNSNNTEDLRGEFDDLMKGMTGVLHDSQ